MNYLAGVLLGLVFLVESFVWFIRSMSAAEYRSKSISTSNIIMYITRVMLVGYQILINYKIETGGGISEVIMSGVVAMLVALLSHALIFGNHTVLQTCWAAFKRVSMAFRIIHKDELSEVVYVPQWRSGANMIVLASLLSTVSLLLVYTLPQIFATLFYDYRLTLSSVGQVISFAGMLITLFVLDPRLFKMHDTGEIKTGFAQYLSGRMWGFFVSAIGIGIGYVLL